MWGSDKGKAKGPASARPTKASSAVDTLIGRQSEVTGDVRFAGGLHVDGKITGRVSADADDKAMLSLGESGLVKGDVRVPHVLLNGSVEGDVYATQRIMLSAKARVSGNVYYKLIEMASGAMVNGQLIYEGDGADEVSAASLHKEPEEGADDVIAATPHKEPDGAEDVIAATPHKEPDGAEDVIAATPYKEPEGAGLAETQGSTTGSKPSVLP